MDKKWTINYLPEDGRLTGHLHVRDDEVTFEALYDSSFKTVAQNIGLAAGALVASGGQLTFLRNNGRAGLSALVRAPSRGARRGSQTSNEGTVS